MICPCHLKLTLSNRLSRLSFLAHAPDLQWFSRPLRAEVHQLTTDRGGGRSPKQRVCVTQSFSLQFVFNDTATL